ncbi:MAG: rRNA maturation RNase YbeY [Candidatus Krumholzibacteriia bacterium]
MRLELVDQRTRPAATALGSDALALLVAPLGRPEWWLNLVLVDDDQMGDLNRRWYGGQGPTDVLSFSYLEAAGEGAAALPAGEAGAACDLWLDAADATEDFVAGEVIVAPGFVADRCAREGWNLEDEWALLLVHGALHVLGWTHETDALRRDMQAREAGLLQAAGITHPLLRTAEEDS